MIAISDKTHQHMFFSFGRIEVSESKDEPYDLNGDNIPRDGAEMTVGFRDSQLNIKDDIAQMPQSNSFFIFSPTNR